MFKFFIFLFTLCVFSLCIAQDSADVHLNFPNNGIYEIRVDNNTVYSTKDFKLPEGSHRIEVWIPGLILKIDTIFVNPDSYNLFYVKNMNVDPSFKQTKRNRINYTIKQSLVFSSLVPTGFVSYFAFRKYQDANLLFSKISELSEPYNSSLDLNYLSKLEDEHRSLSIEYYRARSDFRRFIILAPSLFLCNVGLTYAFFKKYKKRPPKYNPISPFQNHNIKLSIYPTSYGMGLSYRI